MPVYRKDLADGDGVVRRYAIYEFSDERLASRPAGGPPTMTTMTTERDWRRARAS